MRQFVVLLAVGALVVLLAPATFTLAQAEMYSITVMADETTDGDLALIETFLATATDGDLISQSLRRILMAAVGEIWMLVDGRTDGYGNLTLDDGTVQDRKSTRLNSSHLVISYAVFCLKKKKRAETPLIYAR